MLQRERRRTPNTPRPRQKRNRRSDVDDVHERADQRCDVERGDAVTEDAEALEEGAVGTLLVSVSRVVVWSWTRPREVMDNDIHSSTQKLLKQR
jgi:hypothetical protein